MEGRCCKPVLKFDKKVLVYYILSPLTKLIMSMEGSDVYEGPHKVEVTVSVGDTVIAEGLADVTPENCPVCCGTDGTRENVAKIYGSTKAYREGWERTFGEGKEDSN